MRAPIRPLPGRWPAAFVPFLAEREDATIINTSSVWRTSRWR